MGVSTLIRKLLKYDFRSMWMSLRLIWGAVLGLALVNRFLLPWNVQGDKFWLEQANSELLNMMPAFFIFACMAMCVASLVYVLNRFGKGLLGDEGYLMHTLPVASWQLVLSKLLASLALVIANCLIGVLAVLVLVPFRWRYLFSFELWDALLGGLSRHPDTLLYLLEMFLVVMAFFTLAVTAVYLSIAVGHLFSRRRALISVGVYIVLQVLLIRAFSAMYSGDLFWWLTLGGGHLGSWQAVALLLIPAALLFAGTSAILSRRLNLE